MRFVIVTGMSGSGKSEVMSILEDIGYYCIDNLPAELMSKIYEMSLQSQGGLEHVAIGIDVRGYNFEQSYKQSLEHVDESSEETDVLFLDASDEILVRRYKMTRKRHPLQGTGDVLSGIQKERTLLRELKGQADVILDTSKLSVKELRKRIIEEFKFREKRNTLTVSISSFGFKHGLELDADLVMDVRFLPNPYYIPELKERTGNEADVQDYVMNDPKSHLFLDKLVDMVRFLLPNYEEEGKNHLKIAIGCTGGRHRSVTIANLLYQQLKDSDYEVLLSHRDVER